MIEKEELIDLSYWIAGKLFDKHAFEPHPINNSLCEICNKNCHDDIHIWPHYTTDPAAAMIVLEKCLERTKDDPCLYIGKLDSEYLIGSEIIGVEGCSKTLPLAIALFARELFSP